MLLATVGFAAEAKAATYNGTEGAQLSATGLATAACTVNNPPTWNIDWGDGTSSAPTSPSPGQTGPLDGAHTYAEEGTYSGTVTWADDCGSHSATFQAVVADAALTASGTGLTGQAGTPIVGRVATFSDADPGGTVTDYTATITWGDGTPSSRGTITQLGTGFAVNSTHTYARAGSYSTTIAISDAGGATGSGSGTATVSSAPIPAVTRVNPPSGPTAGGTSVTITGNNFTGATAVKFGSSAATNVKVVNSGQITATSPPGTGTVDVTVSTPNGTSPPSAADLFSYIAPPPPPPGSPPPSMPTVLGGAPTTTTSNGAGVTGTVNPEGASTIAYFEYGLDPTDRGPGSSSTLYDQSTPPQQVGSDFANHTIAASLTGLVPAALYHIRLVATNSVGTTVGPGVTFTTLQAPPGSPTLGVTTLQAPPGSPTLGKTFNIAPVSGIVLILVQGQLIPLTGLEQIPAGTVIDALQGTVKLTTALPGGARARDAAAKTKKPKPKVKTQSGNFGGAIFKVTQARTGLATLTLVEGAFKGAPSYATCKAHKAGDASAAALSSKTLQLLHASAHGKFRTSGKYSAATVRGTIWTVADRCDGTLTHDITDSVAVQDFVRHKTIILHAGQSYLARKP